MGSKLTARLLVYVNDYEEGVIMMIMIIIFPLKVMTKRMPDDPEKK